MENIFKRSGFLFAIDENLCYNIMIKYVFTETDMKRFNTVIFDLDGTLLDTIDDLRTAIVYAFGVSEDKLSREQTLAGINFGVDHLITNSAKALGIENYDHQSAREKFSSKYDECYADKTCPFEGIPELLRKLKADGFKIGVFSNKLDFFVKVLCDCKFDKELIDFARGETEGVPVKPDPAGAYLLMESLGASDKTKIAYVGDSNVDVKTAKNAGFYCIGVAWGYRPPELLVSEGADVIAYDASQLYDIITEEI